MSAARTLPKMDTALASESKQVAGDIYSLTAAPVPRTGGKGVPVRARTTHPPTHTHTHTHPHPHTHTHTQACAYTLYKHTNPIMCAYMYSTTHPNGARVSHQYGLFGNRDNDKTQENPTKEESTIKLYFGRSRRNGWVGRGEVCVCVGGGGGRWGGGGSYVAPSSGR